MPNEYRWIDGTLRQGYCCARCGESMNMMGTGHGEGLCPRRPELIQQIRRANPPSGQKPHFTLSPDTFKYAKFYK